MRLDPTDLRPVGHAAVHGDLRLWEDVDLPLLGRRADVYVWLPPGYATTDERYPVLYLHDGQNLFPAGGGSGGATWQVDRAMSVLARDGMPAIVVGVPCHPSERGDEYTPHAHPVLGGGRAADYAAFLADHLKPAVDAALRTRREPEHTVVAGSSLGGVVSAYLWTTRPDTFGAAGVFSPAYWWPGEEGLLDVERVLAAGPPPGRVYVDVGGRERPDDARIERLYVEHARRLVAALEGARVPVRHVYDSQAGHHETAWAERFPAAAAWLLRGSVPPPPHLPATQSDA